MREDFKPGDVVLYLHPLAHLSQAERGVVTSTNDSYVFVRYGEDLHSKATRPEDLQLERNDEPS